jgi:hypothetical protein
MKTTVRARKNKLFGTLPILLFIIGTIIALILLKYLFDYLSI